MAADTLLVMYDWIKFILLYFWWTFILVYLLVVKLKWKKWPMDVIILEKRGSNIIRTNERAGLRYDAGEGVHKYQLQKCGHTIPVYNYEWILHTIAQHTNIFERFVNLIRGCSGTLMLFRYGSKQYKPIVVKTKEGLKKKWVEMKDKNGDAILSWHYKQIDPRDKLSLLNFEVVDWDNMNFMVQEQRASAERRKKKSDMILQILVPLAIIAMTTVLAIVIVYMAFDKAPGLTASVSQPQPQQPAQVPNIPIISDIMPPGS